MSDKSAIQWTEATWNPVTGCTKVSPGCAHCYAETLTKRYAGRPGWPETFEPWVPGNDTVRVHPERLAIPLSWRKPRLVFVNSMSDLFHEEVSDEFIDQVFAVMALAPQHTFLVLTKRPERMRDWFNRTFSCISRERSVYDELAYVRRDLNPRWPGWPLPNVWLGVIAENQRFADERIPILLDTPAAVRCVFCDPLLGPLSIELSVRGARVLAQKHYPWPDWVIVGGESGPKHRPISPEWVRSLRDQCVEAGVPFFFKQFGGPRPASGGRLLDGREWNEG